MSASTPRWSWLGDGLFILLLHNIGLLRFYKLSLTKLRRSTPYSRSHLLQVLIRWYTHDMQEHISGAYTIKQIFEEDGHWERFCEEHPNLRQNIIDEVGKVLRCKDPLQSGYHRYACPQHTEQSVIVPHTCKSRFCTSCGTIRTNRWIEWAGRAFLDVPYRHIVFTIPSELWHIFPYNRALLNILFLAAERTVLDWCKEKQRYVPGVVTVLHTFGSELNFNTHIHMLITQGGLSSDRTQWIANTFIPWDMLKARWKRWIMEFLKPALLELILQRRIGEPYRSLGTGTLLDSFLGFSVPAYLVRPCWRHP